MGLTTKTFECKNVIPLVLMVMDSYLARLKLVLIYIINIVKLILNSVLDACSDLYN